MDRPRHSYAVALTLAVRQVKQTLSTTILADLEACRVTSMMVMMMMRALLKIGKSNSVQLRSKDLLLECMAFSPSRQKSYCKVPCYIPYKTDRIER